MTECLMPHAFCKFRHCGPVAQAEMGLQRAGDCNDDNTVSLGDFNVLKVTYGTVSTDPGYDARADFNGDNTISLTDFTLLKANFGQSWE